MDDKYHRESLYNVRREKKPKHAHTNDIKFAKRKRRKQCVYHLLHSSFYTIRKRINAQSNVMLRLDLEIVFLTMMVIRIWMMIHQTRR